MLKVERLEKVVEILRSEDIVDRLIAVYTKNWFNQCQTDVYVYPDGEIDTFYNPGGNSWLDDDHFLMDTITPAIYQEDYDNYLSETGKTDSDSSRDEYLEELKTNGYIHDCIRGTIAVRTEEIEAELNELSIHVC